MTVPTIRVDGPDHYRIVDSAVPAPRAGEVLVELDSAGICGGDLSLLRGRNSVATYPTVLGHECAGRVVGVGHDATLEVGQPVLIYPTIGCGSCRACRDERINHCARMTVRGLSDPRGCFSEAFTIEQEQCIPVSEAVLEQYGALVEPLAVGVHVVRRGTVFDGDTALVIGTGAIGLATTLVAHARGVRVVGTDRYPERAQVARTCGMEDFTTESGDALAEWVADRLGSVDLVYDTVCNAETSALAVSVLRGGGRYVTIASAKPTHQLSIDYSSMYARELSVIACRNYARQDFAEAVELLETGRVDVRPLHTATFALEDFGRAVEELEFHGDSHIKILMTSRKLLGSRPLLR